jgi:hypothetical protein
MRMPIPHPGNVHGTRGVDSLRRGANTRYTVIMALP